jgi:hypothetical protein
MVCQVKVLSELMQFTSGEATAFNSMQFTSGEATAFNSEQNLQLRRSGYNLDTRASEGRPTLTTQR